MVTEFQTWYSLPLHGDKMEFTIVKASNGLPSTVLPNALYLVKNRTDSTVTVYITDSDGTKAFPIKDPTYESLITSVIKDVAGKIAKGDSLHTALCKLQTQITKLQDNAPLKVITPGKTYRDAYQYKAVVVATNGNWTIDYTAAGFTEVISVIPVAVAGGTDSADRKVACLSSTPYTKTTASGKLMGATVAGLIVYTMAEVNGSVEVTVTGI